MMASSLQRQLRSTIRIPTRLSERSLASLSSSSTGGATKILATLMAQERSQTTSVQTVNLDWVNSQAKILKTSYILLFHSNLKKSWGIVASLSASSPVTLWFGETSTLSLLCKYPSTLKCAKASRFAAQLKKYASGCQESTSYFFIIKLCFSLTSLEQALSLKNLE